MQSMTGFGRAEHTTDHYVARVEMSSVNRKQADIVFHLPRDLAEIEPSLRKQVLNTISRGRVHVQIHLEATSTSTDSLKIDSARAQALESAYVELSDLLNRPIQAQSQDFLRAPGIFLFQESSYDQEEALAAIEPAVGEALKKLAEMRTSEGAFLKEDLLQRILFLENTTQTVATQAPKVVVRQRELLHLRLREAEIELDLNDERLAKEIALFAERCDISEEITRLNAHLTKFKNTLELHEPIGRTLDFLCQELNRELNTIGSKANDSDISHQVVGAKTELEKIREQVQNIE